MRTRPDAPDVAIWTVAIAGAALFVVSLLAGLAAWIWHLGATGEPWSWRTGAWPASLDAAGFTIFACHHSVFVQPSVKRAIESIVTPRLERTCYVVVASVLFLGVCWGWRPVPGAAWGIRAPWSAPLIVLQLSGVWITIRASREVDVFALAGLRQALSRPPPAAPAVVRRGFYRVVRHPIYFAWLLMVWPAPVMSGSRLVFAIVSTVYLVAAIPREERALVRQFGADYERYAADVRWRMLPYVY